LGRSPPDAVDAKTKIDNTEMSQEEFFIPFSPALLVFTLLSLLSLFNYYNKMPETSERN